jgi:hypothetical protein
MASHLAKLVGAALLFAVVACGGCAERPSAGPETASERPVAAEPIPVPAPTPVPIPRELACAGDGACTLSPYLRPLGRAADCYCPECPRPVAAAAAVAHEADWTRLCGAEWAARAGCQAPMCPRPPALVCKDGACAFAAPGAR